MKENIDESFATLCYDIIKEMYEYICIVHEIPTFKLLYFVFKKRGLKELEDHL